MAEKNKAFESRLREIVTRHIAGCTGLIACERLSTGASQETYKLTLATNKSERLLAFRRGAPGIVPQSDRPGLATEALLFQLAQQAGVPEPQVYYILTPEDELGDGFIMQWLEGETLGARIARHEDFAAIRPQLAAQCGEILARIHAIDVVATGLEQKLNRVTPEDYVRQTYQNYLQLDLHQPMIDFTARWLLEHLPTPDALRLVHNDFRNGNLMIDPQTGIVAVLDWELAHIGDAVRDIGWICTNSWRFGVRDKAVGGFGTLEDLLAGYKAASGREIDPGHVMFWQVFGSFWWAVGTLNMGATFRQQLDSSVERPAIGRRSSECQIDCVNLLIPGPVNTPAEIDRIEDTSGIPIDELLQSVSDYLREDIMQNNKGRAAFLARVAANALDMVRRENQLAPENHARQQEALSTLLGQKGNLGELRSALCHRLREGKISLDNDALHSYLRDSVVAQVAIDQPTYTALATALNDG